MTITYRQDTDMNATEHLIKALYAARQSAKDSVETARNLPAKPWRGEKFTDAIGPAKQALSAIESQIIDLEQSLRDPEQDAEMRAEINAAIAINGNYSDDARLYMLTPMEEELFQQGIKRDIEYGYYHPEDGWVDGMYSHYSVGNCQFCNSTVMGDEVIHFDGWAGCENCYEDIKGLFAMLCWLSVRLGFYPQQMISDSYGEWMISKAGESDGHDLR